MVVPPASPAYHMTLEYFTISIVPESLGASCAGVNHNANNDNGQPQRIQYEFPTKTSNLYFTEDLINFRTVCNRSLTSTWMQNSPILS